MDTPLDSARPASEFAAHALSATSQEQGPPVSARPRTTTKPGDDGETVAELQRKINEASGANLEVDGVFGAKTEAAVRQYQYSRGLEVDAVVGEKTWEAIDGNAASVNDGAPPVVAETTGQPGTKTWFQSIAKQAVTRAGVPDSWATNDALATIVERESSFRPTAQNPKSTAYGLFQFLNSTWKGTGVAKTSDPVQQTTAGMVYIRSRYKTPEQALSFWNKHHWY